MSLLKMSFSGAIIILAFIIVRSLVLYKLPKRMLLVFWNMALIRLLIPFRIPSAMSAYSMMLRMNRIFARSSMAGIQTGVPESGFAESQWYPSPAVKEVFHAPAAGSVNKFLWSWNAVWMLGMILVMSLFALAYVRCYRELKKSIPVHNVFADDWTASHKLKRPLEIRYSDRITAPLSYGIFKPVILMPKNTDWNDGENLKYVLAHEYIHICHFDAVIKLLLIVAAAIHWFNPFVWIMYILANRDIELICDEAVIRMYGQQTRKAYAMMLVHMEETRNAILPAANNFSKNAIDVRIDAIMKMKKRTAIIPILTAVVMTCIMVLFATSAQAYSGTDLAAEPVLLFPLSDLNREYVQDKLREEGIDTGSKQYQVVIGMMLKDAAESEDREAYVSAAGIKNLMRNYDEDGDFINPFTGIAGMEVTGKDILSWHKIISVSVSNRQEMFDNAKREFLQESGMANGDTTRRSEVFANYQRSVPKKDRLMGTWTLEQYERQYNKAFYDAVKAKDSSWEPGASVPAGALERITRADIDDSLVIVQGEYGETFARKADGTEPVK